MTGLCSNLLQQTYRCASAPDLWPDTLDRISATLGASRILVQRVRREGTRMRTFWDMSNPAPTNREFLWRIEDGTNPRMEVHLSPPTPGVSFFRDEERLDSAAPEVARLHQLEAEFGYRRFLGARTELGEGETLLMALYDCHPGSPFGAETEAVLHEALPHIAQAVTLGGEFEDLRQWRRLASGALDLLTLGVALCDAQGNVRYANRAAQSALHRASLRLAGDRIEASTPTEKDRLRTLLARAASGDATGTRFGTGDAAVDIMAMAEPDTPGMLVLMISRATVDATALPVAPLCEIHGLTRAEATLASAICTGSSLQDFAATRGISICTARSQLRQVLAKTGATRQSDLVRQVWTSAIAACVGG